MRRRFASAAAGGAIAGLVLLAACGASFEPSHKVQSIRILAAAADKPYAKPGDQVTVFLKRDGKEMELKLTLGSSQQGGRGGPGGPGGFGGGGFGQRAPEGDALHLQPASGAVRAG